jgi:phage gp29-like protein
LSIFSRLGRWLFPQRYARKPEVRYLGGRPPRDAGRWPSWLSSGLTLDRMSSVTRSADQGSPQDYLTLIQEIATKDPLITGLLGTRLAALSQRKVKVSSSPADKDKVRGEEVALFGQSILDGIRLARLEGDTYKKEKGLKGLVAGLSVASYYGAEAGYVHWTARPGEPLPVPVAVELFDERRLVFDQQDQHVSVLTEGAPSQGVPLHCFEPALIVEARATRITRVLSQAGTGRACLIPWWLRNDSTRNLMNYLETWSRPTIIGKAAQGVGAGYSEAMLAAFQNFLEDMMGDSRVLLPPGFDVTTLSAVAGGEAVFETTDKLTERQISFALVGQTGTAAGEGGSLAKAEVNERVQDDVIEGDADMVGETLENLLSHAVALWFGEGVPAPRVEFEVGADPEKLKSQAQAVGSLAYPLKALLDAGIPVDVEALLEPYGITLREDGLMDPRLLAVRKQLAAIATGQAPAEEPMEQAPPAPPE